MSFHAHMTVTCTRGMPYRAPLLLINSPGRARAAVQVMPADPCTGVENWNKGKCPKEAI
jgi:hypothetical protein